MTETEKIQQALKYMLEKKAFDKIANFYKANGDDETSCDVENFRDMISAEKNGGIQVDALPLNTIISACSDYMTLQTILTTMVTLDEIHTSAGGSYSSKSDKHDKESKD